MSEDTIKQGSIADFMRKRTQLVGFDFGLNKHTQYAVEFIDNALDAIETFQWKVQKSPDAIGFLLKDDVILENLDFTKGVTEEDIQRIEAEIAAKQVDDEGYVLAEDGSLTLEIEDEAESAENLDKIVDSTISTVSPDGQLSPTGEVSEEAKEKVAQEEDEEAKKLRALQKKAQELEIEVQNIVNEMVALVKPVQPLLSREPFILVKLTEQEAASIYKDYSKDTKDVYQYTIEIFDNGPGMTPEDLSNFGKYLASSKSQKLKQTRGSQGFGASSAFSDAQNTTGRPVTVVSKHWKGIYGTASQFYTTSKNNKEYVVPPTEIECPFEHGTYIKLTYLNVKYKKGYIDSYVNLNSLTNPHISFVFLDPQANLDYYPRRVNRFPAEPKYALPHPSSVNIGDFQDFLRSSINNTISGFLQSNFVRMSGGLAKTIIDEAEEDLQDKLGLLILGEKLYLVRTTNTADPITIMKIEARVYGKSKKPRDKLIVYHLENEEEKNRYFDKIANYNQKVKEIHHKINQINAIEKEINREEDKKKIKELTKEITANEKEIAGLQKELKESRKDLSEVVNSFSSLKEVDDVKVCDKMEELANDVRISQAPPQTLTQNQTEALFRAFKNQKYMSPPTDTAIPIGSSVLETTLIKEFKLQLSHRVDMFLDFAQELPQMSAKEKELLLDRILTKFKDPTLLLPDFNITDSKTIPADLTLPIYEEFLQNLDVAFATDEDFVAAYTRQPTSGKGLAFVVECVIAISSKIPTAKTPNQAIMRFVNRTPKIRDNSDCAIWKGIQSVNWKNYKIDMFDNGIPRGDLRIMVNVSGPFVHLMFKSQSKNALAEDEVLMKEIKYCLETVGRKVRNFQNKKIRRETSRKRSKTIEKYIPIFLASLTKVVKNVHDIKDYNQKQLEDRIMEALNGKIEDPYKKRKDELDAQSSEEPEGDEGEESDEDEEGKSKKKPKPSDAMEIKSEIKSLAAEEETEEPDENEDEEKSEPRVAKVSLAAEEEDQEEKPKPKEIKESIKPKVSEKPSSPITKPTPKVEAKPQPLTESLSQIKPASEVKITKPASDGIQVKSIDDILKHAAKPVTVTSAPPTTQQKPLDVKSKPTSSVPSKIPTKVSTSSKAENKSVSKPQTIVSTSKPASVPSEVKSTPLAPLPKPNSSLSPSASPSKMVKPQSTLPVGSSNQTAIGSAPKMAKPQSGLDQISTENILAVLKPGESISLRDLLKRLNIEDMQTARYLQVKLTTLKAQNKLNVVIKEGKQYYSIK